MNRSPTIGALAKAVAAAQSEMVNPKMDKENPHFNSRFASFAAVRDAVIPCFSKHGVAVSQDISVIEGAVLCTTFLRHADSGEWEEFGPLAMPIAQRTAQGVASSVTYAKRYGLMAVACVVGDDDDDGNAASEPTSTKARERAPQRPATSPTNRASTQDDPPPAEDSPPPQRVGLSPEIEQRYIDEINACNDAQTLVAKYTEAYRLAIAGGDQAAAQRFLACYRGHFNYVAPQPKQKALT